MPLLEPLYRTLEGSAHVNYFTNTIIPSIETDEDSVAAIIEVPEALTVTHHIEQVTVANLNDAVTLVRYCGASTHEMLQHLEDLKLPSSFNPDSDPGEKIFYLFRSHLREEEEYSGALNFEQKIVAGDEIGLSRVLRKLCTIYDSELSEKLPAQIQL